MLPRTITHAAAYATAAALQAQDLMVPLVSSRMLPHTLTHTLTDAAAYAQTRPPTALQAQDLIVPLVSSPYPPDLANANARERYTSNASTQVQILTRLLSVSAGSSPRQREREVY
jgi:hypothetical protein